MASLFSEVCRLLSLAYKPVPIVTVLLFILGSTFSVNAKPIIGEKTTYSSWGLGIGIYSEQKAYAGVDRKSLSVPILTFENEYIRLAGPELKLKLPSYGLGKSNRLDFSFIGRVDIKDYDGSDTWVLEGMEDRDGGFWVGARVEWKNNLIQITAEFLSELAGDSEGNRFNLSIKKTWHVAEKYTFTPRIEINWNDKKYVDYYYGVQANEVNADRYFYKGQAAVNIEMGARTGYMFERNQLMFLDFSITNLADEIKDSPLIDRSYENSVFLGYIYKF